MHGGRCAGPGRPAGPGAGAVRRAHPGRRQTAAMTEGAQHRSFCRICDADVRDRGHRRWRRRSCRSAATPITRSPGATPARRDGPSRRCTTTRAGSTAPRAGRRRRPAAGTTCSTTWPPGCAPSSTVTAPTRWRMYLATGSAFDATGRRAAERFLGVLGSRQRYTADHHRHAVQAAASPSSWRLVGPHPDLGPRSARRCWLLFGSNPVVSHGHSNAVPDPVGRLREFQARGGGLWVVDPRRTETARLADRHLAAAARAPTGALLGLARAELLPDGADRADLDGARATDVEELRAAVAPFDTSRWCAARPGSRRTTARALLAAVRRAGRLAAVTGTGPTMATDGQRHRVAAWALHVVTDSFDRPGGMWFNPGYLLQLDQRDWPPPTARPEPGPAQPPRAPPSLRRVAVRGPASTRSRPATSRPCRRRRQPGHRLPRARPPPRGAGAPRRARRRRRAWRPPPPSSPPTCCRPSASSSGPTSRGCSTPSSSPWPPSTRRRSCRSRRAEADLVDGRLAGRAARDLGPAPGVTLDTAADTELLMPWPRAQRRGRRGAARSPSGVVASRRCSAGHERVPRGWRLAPAPRWPSSPMSWPAPRRAARSGRALVPHRQLRMMNRSRDISAPGAAGGSRRPPCSCIPDAPAGGSTARWSA